jgi:hypothetical protein
MKVSCKYWVGEITSSDEKVMSTIVVMTSIPITRSELRNTYYKKEIGLEIVNKKNSNLIFTYIVFLKADKTVFCAEDLKISCILKTILDMYSNSRNIDDEFRDKLKIYNIDDEFRDKLKM